MTHRQIINRALLAIGSKPVTETIGSTDPVHIAVSAAYEAAWREVLENTAWSDLLVLTSLVADTDDDNDLVTDADGLYRFTLPDDCIHVTEIRTALGTIDRDAKKIGAYLWSPQEEIRVTYLSGDGLVPVDMTDIDTALEAPAPSVMLDAVAYRLASLIAFSITQNTALLASMDQRYYNALAQARLNDMRPSGGERFWGHYALDDDL